MYKEMRRVDLSFKVYITIVQDVGEVLSNSWILNWATSSWKWILCLHTGNT